MKPHAGHPPSHDHQDHHSRMAADFRNRFWISLVLTLPILILSPMQQPDKHPHGLFGQDFDALFTRENATGENHASSNKRRP